MNDLMHRRRVMMENPMSQIVFPYIYKNGQFAEDLGGYTVPNPPREDVAIADEYYLTPVIYGHFTRNRNFPNNDMLVITSNSKIDLTAYDSIEFEIDIQGAASGAIGITDENNNWLARANPQGLSNGAHVLTSQIEIADPSKINITFFFFANSYNTYLTVKTIKLKRRESS